ncbi:hypothetical protein BDV37DRAFT_267208 [Aspergillus pseudonomiae]|uniref:Uncharacterized protein n=1 Tax=Aspergillus pseudonomiae TaxID=1506151 RepID=A0A5N7CSE8_9EURO|nr:uncharacterized protein BDV37DRAFT_267208 [Aspergillus pseudonomiae]KAE8396859.1 hypothetical protein BDV37DRAFT_267208 [Aspergillus pseudonomiae]
MPYHVCTQEQVRYACGHSKDGQFVKCEKHANNEGLRCSSTQLQYKEVKVSTHRCRSCLQSA